jgi:hypothetical protein
MPPDERFSSCPSPLIRAVPRPACERPSAGWADWLARYSVDLLRISLGLVFLGFGVLKFFPGLSPAESLAAQTLDILTLGLLPERLGLIAVAGLETLIGLLLLSGRWLRLALGLLAVELVGILSPIVLLPGEMFRGSSWPRRWPASTCSRTSSSSRPGSSSPRGPSALGWSWTAADEQALDTCRAGPDPRGASERSPR